MQSVVQKKSVRFLEADSLRTLKVLENKIFFLELKYNFTFFEKNIFLKKRFLEGFEKPLFFFEKVKC